MELKEEDREVCKSKACGRAPLLTPPSSGIPPVIGLGPATCDSQRTRDRSNQDNSRTSGRAALPLFRQPLCTIEQKMTGICIAYYLFFLGVTLKLLSPLATPTSCATRLSRRYVLPDTPKQLQSLPHSQVLHGRSTFDIGTANSHALAICSCHWL